MPDEIISEGSLAVALGAKLLYDVCGPTAKYLGGEAASYTKEGIQNLKKIFVHANKLIQAKKVVGGQIPPRVLKNVINEGYFCEDEIQASYLGGLLASSRGMLSRDDRAVTYTSTIASLSTYQIRAHYLIYSAMLKYENFEKFRPWLFRHGLTIIILEEDYKKAMDFSPEEDTGIIGEHSFLGLERHDLSEGGYSVIGPHTKENGHQPFRFLYPTMQGADLFLWAFGMGDKGLDWFSPELIKDVTRDINLRIDLQHGKVSFA